MDGGTPAPRVAIQYEDLVEPHAPALYRPARVAEPLAGIGTVGWRARRFYRRHGYLAIEGVFSAAEVADALAGLHYLLHDDAVVRETFLHRSGDGFHQTRPTPDPPLRKLTGAIESDARLRALAESPALLGLLGRLLGDRPVLHQEICLLKPPTGREKPWHQDLAYFDFEPARRPIGVWIALDEATVDNGCMRLLDRGHRLGPLRHCVGRDWQLPDANVGTLAQRRPVVAAPLAPGGLLVFDTLLPHGTPTNPTDTPRRSLQLHYRAAGAREIPIEQRMARFGSEGRSAEC